MKIKAISAVWLSALGLAASTVHSQTLDIQSAGDFGGAHNNYPASNAVDGDTAFASRWAANFSNGGGDVNLFVDLGSVQRIDDIGVAWGRGNLRSYNFEVRARAGTSGSWTKIRNRANSSGSTTGIEQYNVTDFDARQVRIKVFSASDGAAWANVTEFEVYGTSGRSGGNDGSGGNGGGSGGGSGGSGSAVSVPARIEAEDFTDYSDTTSNNIGGAYRNTPVDIQSCNDSGCGFNIGWAAAGEWLEYQIDVDDPGNYEADLRLATRQSGRVISVDVDGSNVTGNVSVNNTGNWQNYYTETVDLGNLSSGTHTVRFNFENGSVNFNWIEITESSGGGSGGGNGGGNGGSGEFNLDPNAEPWENFDLSQWKIDTPAGESSANDCDAQDTEPQEWNNFPSRSEEFFFTHTDGGMRFISEIGGGTTGGSCNSRPRSELREMLRGSNTNIDTDGKTSDGDDDGDYRNNWALGYQPNTSNAANPNQTWGAREGIMRATLRVNEVTTSGKDSSRGRVVIGQIHAKDDEPLRLNYKHRAGFQGGCIYAASEKNGGDDTDFVLAGSNTSCSSDPGNNGLGLGELFSYEIENRNEDIIVTIYRGDFESVIDEVTIDLNQIQGGYDVSDDWMYFKAGAYTQNSINDDGDEGDRDIVTFYRLEVEH